MSICVHGGLQEGGLLQIQEDIQSAFQVSLEGVHPYYVATSRGHLLLLPVTGNTSAGVRFELCNLNSEGPAKQTSCSPEMFGEGRGLPSRTTHTRQIKHWAAGRKHTKEARQQESCQKKHDRQVEQHGERNNDARWQSITQSIHVWIILSQNQIRPYIKHNKRCTCYLNW